MFGVINYLVPNPIKIAIVISVRLFTVSHTQVIDNWPSLLLEKEEEVQKDVKRTISNVCVTPNINLG